MARFAIAGLFLGGAIALSTPALADVKAGVDAWSGGDYAAAVREWAQPAAQGDPDAQFNMAQAYRLGRGVEADRRQAEALYLLAAQQGHVRAADNYGLLIFQDGRRQEAMPYVQAAAERGDPRAQYLLGVAHFNGDLVEKDWVRAYALATLANSSGLPQARGAIGQMDRHIPIEQRQEAQVLARVLKRDAENRRSSELAAIDLAVGAEGSGTELPRMVIPRVAGQGAAVRQPMDGAAPGTTNTDLSLPGKDTPAIAATRRPAPRAASVTAPARGEWKVQLGAFGVSGNADRLWDRLAGTPALAGATKLKEPAGRLTKLLAAGFASQAEALRACAALKATGQDCLVTK